jgi:hypothetical protein
MTARRCRQIMFAGGKIQSQYTSDWGQIDTNGQDLLKRLRGIRDDLKADRSRPYTDSIFSEQEPSSLLLGSLLGPLLILPGNLQGSVSLTD